jgi:hypothetical protein
MNSLLLGRFFQFELFPRGKTDRQREQSGQRTDRDKYDRDSMPSPMLCYHAEAAVAPSETYGDTEASMPPLSGRHTVTLRFYPKDSAAILAAEAIRFN